MCFAERQTQHETFCSTKPHSSTIIQQSTSVAMRNAPSKLQQARHVNKSIGVSVSNHESENNLSGLPNFQCRCPRIITKKVIANTASNIGISCPSNDGQNFQSAPTNPSNSSQKVSIIETIQKRYRTNLNPTTFGISRVAHPHVRSLLFSDSSKQHDRTY